MSVVEYFETAPRLEDRIELEFPAVRELLFLARIVADAVGERANFGHDQVSDLRLAAHELLANLVRGQDPQKKVLVEFEWSEGVVELVATARDPSIALLWHPSSAITSTTSINRCAMTEELSEYVMDDVTDSHGTASSHSCAVSWLRMRASRSSTQIESEGTTRG